ncbi:hypothetical protein HYALB_00009859 [Hymenoscyphus albidus]|uniref:C2H2-type domain-containing protein n=1 Tax=Hymenoscyphus albidus TaxID=595503 RepID=A0A9N9PQ71_9HELO|nr:hypothetical protein HYALB_00009859 [Hymenoscyphus albidus]
MELTPQSQRSPTSPFRYTSNPQPLYEYPSPAQSDSHYKPTEPLQGLGLYSCAMTGSPTDNGGSVVTQLPSSTTATNHWPTTNLQHRNEPRSTQSTPNILSADYDPFTPFHPAVPAAYSHDIYSTQTAESSILPASPAPSGHASQRSSFSSTPASEIFTQPGSIHSYTPHVKMEDHPEYASSNGESIMISASPQLNHNNILVSSTSPYPGSLEATYYQDQQPPLEWPKIEYPITTQDLPSISSLPIPPYDRRSESQERGVTRAQARRGHSTIARTRQPRKLTTKEDANFQCTVKGCGKLFGRSYNYKAHMETHDASREYPFPCPMKDCNKKFVRKTDLQRHHQSVHMKQRNHRCDYCSRFFARKDTLRRHMEDGCSKRFDIETVDFRPQIYTTNPHPRSMRVNPRQAENASRQASYSSSNGLGPHDSALTAAPGPYLERHGYLSNNDDHHQQQAWSS